jgi:hypothetical protein
LFLTLTAATNPMDAGDSGFFTVKTYDGFKSSILERSYDNLDPFYFSYTYPGPSIIINNDLPITVEAGTQTPDLYVKIPTYSNLNLTLKPATPSGMSFVPFSIDVKISDYLVMFRVSVVESFTEGSYEISWEILGELIPPYNTPVKNTQVIVTKNRGVQISIANLNVIPFGGTSLPAKISVINGPDDGFELHLITKFDYKGISLSSNIIYFSAGVTERSFSVYYTDKTAASTENISSGTIQVSLSGTNHLIYNLPALSLGFTIASQDISQPSITSITEATKTRTTITLTVTADDISAVYWMNALEGTKTPTFDEVKNQGPPQRLTTNSTYGVVYLDATFTNTISLTVLYPEYHYTLFGYIEDRGGNVNPTPNTMTFITALKDRAMIVSLRFNQSSLNNAEIQIISAAVAFT